MRLVKAASALFLVGAGCTDPAPPPASDCSLVLVTPRDPHVVAVDPTSGAPVDEAACGSAACLAGSRGAWVRKDGDVLVLTVGGTVERLAPIAASRLGALGMPGVVLGRDVAVVDEGAELRIIDAKGTLPARAPAPPLADRERVIAVARSDRELRALITRHFFVERAVQLLPAPEEDRRLVLGPDYAPFARLLGEPPAQVRFLDDGTVVSFTFSEPVLGGHGRGDFVLLAGPRSSLLVHRSGKTRQVGRAEALNLGATVAHAVHVTARTIETLEGPPFKLAPDAHHDLAGAPLPEGARVDRVLVASEHDTALVIERVRARNCDVEDRVHLVDAAQRTIRTVAAGEGMRMHPAFAGDHYRFVGAAVDYSTP